MSNAPTPAAGPYGAAAWVVKGAAQTVAQDATGRFTKGWDVTYQLDSGHAGTVFVAGEILNQDTVKAAVQQSATALHGVVNLTSGG